MVLEIQCGIRQLQFAIGGASHVSEDTVYGSVYEVTKS